MTLLFAQWISAEGQRKQVVLRCLHSYSISMLAGDAADGVTYTGIPWVSLGRELPVQVRTRSHKLHDMISAGAIAASRIMFMFGIVC